MSLFDAISHPNIALAALLLIADAGFLMWLSHQPWLEQPHPSFVALAIPIVITAIFCSMSVSGWIWSGKSADEQTL